MLDILQRKRGVTLVEVKPSVGVSRCYCGIMISEGRTAEPLLRVLDLCVAAAHVSLQRTS